MSLCICLILLLGAVMLSAASQANPGPGTDDDLSEEKKQTTKMLGKKCILWCFSWIDEIIKNSLWRFIFI